MVARITRVDDLIKVEKFTSVADGTVVADGTQVNLGPLPEKRAFLAKVQMQQVDVPGVSDAP